MKWLFLALIHVYRWTLRPFVAGRCRFYPSCSEYSYEAIKKYGGCKGGYLTVKRLCKCHPWHPGGVDEVP